MASILVAGRSAPPDQTRPDQILMARCRAAGGAGAAIIKSDDDSFCLQCVSLGLCLTNGSIRATAGLYPRLFPPTSSRVLCYRHSASETNVFLVIVCCLQPRARTVPRPGSPSTGLLTCDPPPYARSTAKRTRADAGKPRREIIEAVAGSSTGHQSQVSPWLLPSTAALALPWTEASSHSAAATHNPRTPTYPHAAVLFRKRRG